MGEGREVVVRRPEDAITTRDSAYRVSHYPQVEKGTAKPYLSCYAVSEPGGMEAFMAGPEYVLYAPQRYAKRCLACGGMGQTFRKTRYGKASKEGTKEVICEPCNAIGFFGIDPHIATTAMPGSYLKQAVLAARYRLVVELWDAYEKLMGIETGLPDGALAVLTFHPGDASDENEEFAGVA